MLIDIREYFTEIEQEQMDKLIKRALSRIEQHDRILAGSEQCRNSECQSGILEDVPGGYRITFPDEEEFYALERLLQKFCNFCLRFDLCQCSKHRDRRKRAFYKELLDADDPLNAELPF